MYLCLFAAILLQGLNTSDGNQKQAISQIDARIAKTPNNSILTAQKAVLLFRDQELERAIKTFLVSLQDIHSNTPSTPEDQALYEKALAQYLEHGASTAQQSAQQILEQYRPTLEQHPDYHLLEFLVAASYANQGRFDLFFDHFYSAYSHHSDHYFAYKTIAILHIKLLERARTDSERTTQKKEIVKNINLALERYPNDHGLYKMLIHFSDPDKINRTIADILNKIIEKNIVVPRSDIAYYVQKSLDAGHRDLAKRFVEKAQEWYKYSRAIETAENMLNEGKNH